MLKTNNLLTQSLNIYSDGGARGNPGPAAAGYVIYQSNGDVLYSHGEYLGETSNNVAEYQAIKKALQYLLDAQTEVKNINCYLDSELVVKQLNGEYKIKKQHLFEIAQQVKTIIQKLQEKGLEKIIFTHIPRAQNKQADALVNAALDNSLEYIGTKRP